MTSRPRKEKGFKAPISPTFYEKLFCTKAIYAAVVTFVAESLEAGGLPGYPEVFVSLK